MLRISAFFVFVVSLLPCLKAQEFGGNPPSLKWWQVNTDTVRVIFPIGLEKQAQRVANTIHFLNKNHNRSIGDKYKKIDIVLQNQTMISNGYVGLAPYRSEFYLTAPQDIHVVGGNWMDVLAIHEYRHVQQFNNARVGLTRFAFWVGGQLGWSTLSRLSIPDWFWEGDAVVYETALTAQGRGRMPAFYNGYRGLAASDRIYSYQKARNGSFKDFVPDHYHLGYLLTAYGRNQYGNDFWKDVVSDAAAYRGLFYSYSRSLKSRTDLNVNEFYRSAFDFYTNTWARQEESISLTSSEKRNAVSKNGTFTTYRHPYVLDDGRMVVYKESYKQTAGFYIIDENGSEARLLLQGIALDDYFSYRDGKMAWTEMGFDERWGWQNYANIVVYDMAAGKKRKITSRCRYMSPDISHRGDRIGAVRISPDQKVTIEILDIASGRMLMALPNPENLYFAYPKWMPDDQSILAVARNDLGRSALVRIELSTGDIEPLTPFTDHQVGIPYVSQHYVFFSASFSGIDNIYALRRDEPGIYQVNSTMIGSYDASVDENEKVLLFSEFSSMGNDIRQMPLEPKIWKRIEVVEPVRMAEYQLASQEEEGGDILGKIPDDEFQITKYPGFSKMINVHTWGFYFDDPNIELAIRSNNIMNTLDLEGGVRYNRNEENFTYFIDGSYAQLYPQVNLSASFARRSDNLIAFGQDNEGNTDTLQVSAKWLESVLRPGISVPFNISSGNFFRSLGLFVNYDYRMISKKDFKIVNSNAYEVPSEWFLTTKRNSIEFGLVFRNIRQRAIQNIFPKYSQYLAIRSLGAIDQYDTKQYYFDSEFTFPALAANHSLNIQLSYQAESASDGYRYPDNFMYPRGYDRPHYQVTQNNILTYDRLAKVGVNYHIPLFYPDGGIPGIIYIYRLRGNAFFDYSMARFDNNGSPVNDNFNSVGGELVLDTNLLNTYALSLGFRYSYLLNQNPIHPNRDYLLEFFVPVKRF